MKHDYYIPKRDREFNSWQDNWFKTLLPNAEAWNIPAVEVTQLTELKSAWEAAFLLADEPSTKTSVAVQNKNNARKEYQDAIRHVVNLYITYNVSITDGQRRAMGVTVHKTTRTPVPVPTSFPEVTLVDSNTTRR
ncbi:MAG: hypothetical protein LBM07_04190, partial [Culturomica sp.]|nr:hypothetical protein [Culturomica sp.]